MRERQREALGLRPGTGAVLGTQGGDARRLLVSAMVLKHHLSAQDPLAVETSDDESIAALLSPDPVSLEEPPRYCRADVARGRPQDLARALKVDLFAHVACMAKPRNRSVIHIGRWRVKQIKMSVLSGATDEHGTIILDQCLARAGADISDRHTNPALVCPVWT